MVPISQRLTILNNNTSILPVCKIVFGQICTRNQDVIVENMRLHMMHSKNFPERRIGKLALKQTGVGVMVKSKSNWSIEVVKLKWF
jgi:hypothetical protein